MNATQLLALVDNNGSLTAKNGDLIGLTDSGSHDQPQGTLVSYIKTRDDGVEIGYYGDQEDLIGLPFAELEIGRTWRYVSNDGGYPAFDNDGVATFGQIVDGKVNFTKFTGQVFEIAR